MEPQLTTLSLLSLLLLIGIIISIVSSKLKIPDLLLLILTGMLISQLKIFSFNEPFLISLSVFALIMILFESSSKFKLKEVRQLSPPALKLAFVFLILSLFLLTLVTHGLFSNYKSSIKGLILSGLFGALMCGTSPDIILSFLKEKKQKIAEMIQLESIINTPLTVLIPILVIQLYFGTINANLLFIKFLQSIMTGVGTGLIIGLVVFQLFMKKSYQELISPLAVIASALLTYTLAENIGGNGVLAVTALGLVFAGTALKEKEDIQKFSSIFTNFLKIVIFLILGIIIKIPLNPIFILKSIFLFAVYIGIRYIAVNIAFYKINITKKEKIFMGINAAKGLAVAVVIFLLSSYTISGLQTIIDLSFLFILYSIILSSVSTRFIDYFIVYRKNVLKKKVEVKVIQNKPKVA